MDGSETSGDEISIKKHRCPLCFFPEESLALLFPNKQTNFKDKFELSEVYIARSFSKRLKKFFNMRRNLCITQFALCMLNMISKYNLTINKVN